MAAKERRRPGVLGRLLRLAAVFWQRILLATLLGVATVASNVGLMSTAAFIIARAALQPSIAELQIAIVGVRFFGIVRGLFRYSERLVSHDVNLRLLARLRVWFYEKLEPLAPARLMHYRSGDLLARIVADVETLEDLFVRVLAPPLVALAVMVGMGLWFGHWSAALALVLVAVMLLSGLVLPVLARWLGKRDGAALVATRAELNVALVDAIQGSGDLLAFGQEETQRRRIGQLGRQLAAIQARMARLAGLQAGLASFVLQLGILGVLVVAIPLVSNSTLDGVVLAVLVLAVIASFEAVLPLPSAFQYLERSLAAGRRLFEIVDAEPAVTDPERPQHPAGADYSLVVRDLTFRYQPGERPALSSVDFELQPGRTLAVVGPSGAGKSTLVNLLLRFWDYREGSIRLGDCELREMAQDEVRQLIAVVSQRTTLFNASIRDNLLLARPGAGDQDLIQAAQQAQVHEFIMSLPQAYDTWVGEQGLRLSGGERQRIAIARAILKDAPIFLLDEAAANLDAVTEQAVGEALRALAGRRTTLVVTHRLPGLEAADEILVLNQGRVAERGRHDDLLAQKGLYWQMWQAQSGMLG